VVHQIFCALLSLVRRQITFSFVDGCRHKTTGDTYWMLFIDLAVVWLSLFYFQEKVAEQIFPYLVYISEDDLDSR